MFEFLRSIVGILVPVFVVSTMLKVGLTQRPSAILRYLRKWPFVLRMVIANFVLVPALMIVILRLTSFGDALEVGLLIFSLCAGAPFLIKLTRTAGQDVALGAAVMVLLLVLTVAYVPFALPALLPGASVGAWAVARPLLVQMLLPIALGMLVARLFPGFARAASPWVARLANVALYAVVVATLVGYSPNMREIVGTGAIFAGLGVVLGGFGYLAGLGKSHLEDVGALGTAQRNTAAGLIVATQNFGDPNVLVILTLVNTLDIVMLLAIARFLSWSKLPIVVTLGPPGEPPNAKELR
jgi:BASS family bile acid:Na+ symporter